MSVTPALQDYDARAQQHRPRDESALARECYRLLATGMKPRDVAVALRVNLSEVLTRVQKTIAAEGVESRITDHGGPLPASCEHDASPVLEQAETTLLSVDDGACEGVYGPIRAREATRDVLENEALLRITAAQEVAAIVGDMALVTRTLPPHSAAKLYGAFILLAECQAALLSNDSLPQGSNVEPRQVRAASESNAERFAHYWNALERLDSGERIRTIRARTGWSSSKAYRLRAEAQEKGLLF